MKSKKQSQKSKEKSQPRESFQKKQAKKGVKSMRNQPEDYDQLKQKTTVCMTPDAQEGANQISQQLGISRSEFFERVGRGRLKVQGVDYEALSLPGKGKPETPPQP